jgi:hypothetical protein
LVDKILRCFDDAVAFSLPEDMDFFRRVLGHLEVSQGILIQLASFDSHLEDAPDLFELFDHRRRAVALIEAGLTVVFPILEAHTQKVLVAHHADETPHGRGVLFPRARANLIPGLGQTVCHEITQLPGLGLWGSHPQFTFLLGLFTLRPLPISMAQRKASSLAVFVFVVDEIREVLAVTGRPHSESHQLFHRFTSFLFGLNW